VQANQWHVSETDAIFDKGVYSLNGADGGLVCFLSKWRWYNNEPTFYYVINPLTKHKRQLPPLLCIEAKKSNTWLSIVKMLKLTVDKKTKEYKVFILSFIANGDEVNFAQVYDSHIKEWTVMEAIKGHIIGWDYWPHYWLGISPRLCVYNFGDGTLQHFNGFNIALELEVGLGYFVHLEDHLFVLHKEVSLGFADRYCISEFHLSEKATGWVKLGVRSCVPCKAFFRETPLDIINMKLFGCNGFLLVYIDDFF